MEQQNCLGIYLSQSAATVVLLGRDSQAAPVRDAFAVSVEQGRSDTAEVISLIGRQLAVRNFEFGEVFAAVDGAMFTQHNIHSAFTEHRQIAGTIRFDAEEILTTDATNIAVTFQVGSSDQNGSDVTVFTAERQILVDLLAGLQNIKLDPVAIEPDVVCLGRFLKTLPARAGQKPLFAILSERLCCLINLRDAKSAAVARSFLLEPSDNITAVLGRQIMMTVASQTGSSAPDTVLVAGRTEQLDLNTLRQLTGLAVEGVDIFACFNPDGQIRSKCPTAFGFAAAFGAAVAEEVKKTARADFRQDFMPYEGRKLALRKTLRTLSMSVTVILITVGIYLQMEVLKTGRYIRRLDDKIAADYADATGGRKHTAKEAPHKALARQYTDLQRRQQGLTGDENAVITKLGYALEALNSAPKSVDLTIGEISITEKNIKLTGDTNSRAGTLALFKAIDSHSRLKKANEDLRQKGNRDSFTINIELKN